MLPILIQLPEFILYSYPFLMGLGWGIGYQFYFGLLPVNVKRSDAQILFWGVFITSWIGAKLLFSITFPHKMSTTFLGQISFWTGGGFVFYGGLLTGILFILVFKHFKKLDQDMILPLVTSVTMGHAVGRIGCFLAGCCYGKVTDAWWGVFMHEAYRHPTQLIEAFGLLALGLFLLKARISKMLLLSTYLITYGVLRIAVESLRGDMIRGNWAGLSPSQWISFILILAGCLLISKNKSLIQSQAK